MQEIRQQRHRRTATGKSNMFSGLVFCDDCKQKLYYSTTNYFEKRQDFFILLYGYTAPVFVRIPVNHDSQTMQAYRFLTLLIYFSITYIFYIVKPNMPEWKI